tara:strand:+ start:143 stop:301 length:159 start_codon:yes stop_codon:yes gene_type:complete
MRKIKITKIIKAAGFCMLKKAMLIIIGRKKKYFLDLNLIALKKNSIERREKE